MYCPATLKPTINGLKEKYPHFRESWTTFVKDSIIRKGLEQLPKGEIKLLGLKDICKKQWNFESDCEYDVVVKDLSRRFGETKQKYYEEFSQKFPRMFSKIIHKPSIDEFTVKTSKKTMERCYRVSFEAYGCFFDLSEENMDALFDYAKKLNRLI